MRCEETRELVSAWIDGELAGEQRQAVAAHIEGCPVCAGLAADYRRTGHKLAAFGREPAPADLGRRIAARLADEADGIDLPAPLPVSGMRRFDPAQWTRLAAALLVACAFSALAAWTLAQTGARQSTLEREVVAAHIRSLLADSPAQVASAETHTVKPWFAGRLDYSPVVKDLSAEGFPLVGGRLDYLADRRVAALVYKRRLHVVNVFLWPAAGASATEPRLRTINGYNVASWTAQGMTYWAISDLNASELLQLPALM